MRTPTLLVALAARLRRVYRGWWIVWISYYSQVITAGAGSWVFGSLILSMQGDLGWNQKTVVGVLILDRWISGLLSFALGSTVDRHGSRVLMTSSAIVAGFGLMLVSLAHSPLMFYAAWALFGVSQPGVNLLGPRVTISNWFVRKRTQAFVILTVGGATAGFIAVPIAAQIDARYGWRAVWVVFGVLCWTIAPLTWWAFRRRPEDIGLLPDGDPTGVAASSLDGSDSAPVARVPDAPWTVREALRTRSFWLLTFGFLCVGMPGAAIIINISGFVQGFGYSKEIGASVVSVYGLGVLGSRPVWGVLLSKIGLHRTMVAFAAIYGLAIMVFTLQGGGRLGIYLTTLSLGIAIGGSQLLNTQALPDYYGRRIVGSLTGLSQLANTAVAGSAPLLTAAVFDATGGYVPAFLFFAAACVAATVAFFFSPPPVHPSVRNLRTISTPDAAVTSTPGQQEERRHAAATRSYVTPAVITLILYLILWLPGLIVNLVYLQHAGRDAALLGQNPDGKGCLTALLWVFGLLPAMLLILWFVVFGAILSGAR